MNITSPRKDVTKFLISTPANFVGECIDENYYLVGAYNNHRLSSYAARSDERIFRQYIELAAITPEYDKQRIVIPDYTHVADNFCIALSVLFGKRFNSHGLTQQHGRGYVPVIGNENEICNKDLPFNSLSTRADYSIPLDLSHFRKIQPVIFELDEDRDNARKTFLYAGRFYAQALRQVEDSPEIAFLSLISIGEILAAYCKYPKIELIDEQSKQLLNELRERCDVGERMASRVEEKLFGISEGYCKFLIECLDDGFFQRSEAKFEYERLKKDDIKQRLKAAYDIRSQFVHAGKFQSNWMSVNSLHNGEEVIHGDPVIEDKDTKRNIKRSPTFIGLERITRYALLKFLERTNLVENVAET